MQRTPEEELITESMQVSDADAAFVLGKGGSTKMKIARVSGARLDLQDRDGRLDIFGNNTARTRAKDYVSTSSRTTKTKHFDDSPFLNFFSPMHAVVSRLFTLRTLLRISKSSLRFSSPVLCCAGYVLTQRTGPVYIDVNEVREDLSIVNVPEARLNNNLLLPTFSSPTTVFSSGGAYDSDGAKMSRGRWCSSSTSATNNTGLGWRCRPSSSNSPNNACRREPS